MYRQSCILDHISITINQGDCIILRGSNGSGKSTLLRILCNLTPFTAGSREVHYPNLVIGYVPDRFPQLKITSSEYLTHIGQISGLTQPSLAQKINEFHQFFQLPQDKVRRMNQFSKGMLQKVNVMQAMLHQPNLLVLDEPFSGLDSESEYHLLSALKLIKAEGTTIIAAVHESHLAKELDGVTYYLRDKKLCRDREDDVTPQHDNDYKLVFILDAAGQQQLIDIFPQVHFEKAYSSNHVTCVISKEIYQQFLILLLQLQGDIVSLVRWRRPS